MAGDRPQMGEGQTGWTSTPYYQQVQAQQQVIQQPPAGPKYITTTTTTPQSEFMVSGPYGSKTPVSVAPGAPYPFGATRITERTEDTTGALSVVAGGQAYQLRQGAVQEPQQPVQVAMPTAMINPKTGEFLYQGQPEYKYYAEPESGSIIEIFHGGKLIPTSSGIAAVQVSGQPFFGVGPDWEQVEIHGGKLVEINAATSQQAASLLAPPPANNIIQGEGVGLPVDVAKFLESQGIDWGKELPGWEKQVYETGMAKTVTGPEGSYFQISPLAGGVSISYQPSFQKERMQVIDYPAYSIVERFKPGETTPYLSEAIPTGSQFASQADMDKWFGTHPVQPAQYSTENIIVNALGFGQGSGLENTTAAQFARLYGQGVQAVETAAKTAINIATPLGSMQEAIATKAWEHPFEFKMPYQVRYAEEHPSDILTTAGVVAVPLGGFAAVPMELIGGGIAAVASEGIKTLFTPGYDASKANQWQSEFLSGMGSAAVAGQAYNVLRPGLLVSPQANIVSQLARTGDIALATEASAFAGGVTYTGISTSLQGRQASYSELATAGVETMMLALPFAGLSLRAETQAQQNYLKQLQETTKEPKALFEVAKKVEGPLGGKAEVTEASEFEVPGIVDKEYVNRLLQEQGTSPLKEIVASEGGRAVTYPRGTFTPGEENPFTGTIKTEGGTLLSSGTNIPIFYGEEPGLPEMMTSGYVPTKVSAEFNLQYMGLAPAGERMSFNFPSAEPEIDLSAAKQFFDIKTEVNPFKDIQNIAYIKYPQGSDLEFGMKQVFPALEGRTAGPLGDYTMKLPVGAEQLETVEPWYSGTGLEDKLTFLKIPADYFTTGVKYQLFEPPEGAVVSPESFKGIVLSAGQIEWNLPKGTPSYNIGDLGVDIISFKTPPAINLALTEGDKSLIRGMQQSNLVEEMQGAGELSGKNLDSLVQQEVTKLQEQRQVIISVKQFQQAEPLGMEALAKNYGISQELFPFTIPQASEVPVTLPMVASVYERSTLQSQTALSNMFMQPTSQITQTKITELPSVNIKPFIVSSTAANQKQASDISDRFKFPEITKQIDMTKYTDLFKVTPIETQDIFQKPVQQQITFTPTPTSQTITWKPWSPPPPPPPTKGIINFPKGMGEIPGLPKGWGKPGRIRKGKPRSTFAPISDLWSRTASELMTGKIAHSPSVKVAQKFWKQTGGEFVPTAEMLAMKPRKPQKPFRMPRLKAMRKPKAARKPKGMSMQRIKNGFKLR